MSEPSKKRIFLTCLIIGCIPALISIIFLWVCYCLPSPWDKLPFTMMATFMGRIPWGVFISDILGHFLPKFTEPGFDGVEISFGAAMYLTIVYLVNWTLNATVVFLLILATATPPKKKPK